MSDFLECQPSRENYWRSIILFGRNVASYKFALALLEFKDRKDDLVTLEDLALPFARHVCGHLAHSPKQSTAPSSRFLNACDQFNTGKMSETQLQEITCKLGFNNVIDAFHVVNQSPIDLRFFEDERKTAGGIRLTEELLNLQATSESIRRANAFAVSTRYP